MELIRFAKRRSLVSEIFYILFNVALAFILFVLVLTVDNIWLPLGLALLSKWRILAVRPRYWWANLLSNTVDIIVTLGYVVFLYSAQGVIGLQIAFLVLFIGWLLFIKPRSSRVMVGVQALTAIFVGTTSVAFYLYDQNVVFMVIAMWVIGYASARHFLSVCDTDQTSFLSIVWGFLFAELGWIGYHWLFTYAVFGTADFKLVQLALIATLLSFLAGRAIAGKTGGRVWRSDMVLPMVFSLGLVVVLALVFNNITAVGSI